MELGTGVALGTLILSAGGVCIKWIDSRRPAKSSGNGNGKCAYHDGMQKSLDAGERRMDQMCKDTTATRRVVMAIAAHLNIPIKDILAELKDIVE